METQVVDEPVTVVVSQKGWLRARQGHGHDATQFGFKTGDSLYDAIECRSTQELMALSSTGRSYSIAVASLPSARGDGQPVTSMVGLEPGGRIVHMLAGAPDRRVLLGVASGYGFLARIGDLSTLQHAGKQFITLDKGDALLKPLLLRDDDTAVALLSRKGKFLVVALDELKTLSSGGRGTILMGLDEGDRIEQWAGVGAAGVVLRGVYRARDTELVLTPEELALYAGRRARKGRLLDVKIKQPSLWPGAGD
jgi:topoisomerase-4 subunit A